MYSVLVVIRLDELLCPVCPTTSYLEVQMLKKIRAIRFQIFCIGCLLALLFFSSLSNCDGNTNQEGAMRDILPPGNITELFTNPEERKVFLQWKNPIDTDFTKVEVSWFSEDINSMMEFEGFPEESMNETITGLVDGAYVFTFKTIDATGNKQGEGIVASITLNDVFPPGI